MRKSKQQYVKFGLQVLEHGSFGLIAMDKEQARMLAEISSITDERISSFGPVTKDDSLTQILWITSRKENSAFNKKYPEKKRQRAK